MRIGKSSGSTSVYMGDQPIYDMEETLLIVSSTVYRDFKFMIDLMALVRN